MARDHKAEKRTEGTRGLSRAVATLQDTNTGIGNRAIASFLSVPPQVESGMFVQRILAAVTLNGTGPDPIVEDLTMERGGTAGGAHATSYGVFEWGAYNAVVKKHWTEGMSALRNLSLLLKNQPGFKSGSKVDFDLTALLNVPFNADGAKPGIDVPLHMLSQVMQNFVVNYLKIRNSLEGTYLGGGVSGAKGVGEKNEQTGGKDLYKAWKDLIGNNMFDQGGTNAKLFAKGMHATHDDRAFPARGTTADNTYFDLVFTIAKSHILSCLAAFPGFNKMKKESIILNYVTQYIERIAHITFTSDKYWVKLEADLSALAT